ncbi:MAG: ATP-binding protein [Verrucomicrobia bacterium]|nr:ATP-binding protein [Verrucomicrobiota bacterium]
MNLDKLYTIHVRLTKLTGGLPKRYIFPMIATPRRLTGLVGPRGVGKTTLLLQILAEAYDNPAEGLYISADHIHVAAAGLYTIAEEHHRSGGQLLAIDEIHKHPNWAQELKSIYDSFPEMRLIISGSSSLQVAKLGYDLSRRLVKHEMKCLSFREFIGFKTGSFPAAVAYEQLLQDHVQIAADLAGQGNILALFREYLRSGYYPFWLEGLDDYWPKLQNVLDKILYEDIPTAFSVRPPGVQQMKRLLSIVAISGPFQINVSAVAREVGMSRETLYEYLDHLHGAYILNELWLPGAGTRFKRKPGKLFFENGSLLTLLANTNTPAFVGALRETFVVNQLCNATDLKLSSAADFQDATGTHFEVGGASKDGAQLPKGRDGYILVDDTEVGSGNRIPLYLVGFLY